MRASVGRSKSHVFLTLGSEIEFWVLAVEELERLTLCVRRRLEYKWRIPLPKSLEVLAGTAESRDVTEALTWAKNNCGTLRRLWREYLGRKIYGDFMQSLFAAV
jgi:hypothetical protein